MHGEEKIPLASSLCPGFVHASTLINVLHDYDHSALIALTMSFGLSSERLKVPVKLCHGRLDKLNAGQAYVQDGTRGKKQCLAKAVPKSQQSSMNSRQASLDC